MTAVQGRTRVAQALGLELPIIQGPFGGGLSSIPLATAVSEAGGLGSFGAHHLPPSDIAELVATLKQSTSRPFAVNLWVPHPDEITASYEPSTWSALVARLAGYFEELGVEPPQEYVPKRFGFDEQIDTLLEAAPPVISFVFGAPPADVVERAHRHGIRLTATATTLDEALELEKSGVDVIVASGSDAGGHRGAFLAPVEESLVGTFSLVPQVASAVSVPVVAAGGIATTAQVRAAHQLGAEGVQIGTAFLISHESIAPEAHKSAITGPDGHRTVLTAAFTGRPARGLPNRMTREFADQVGLLPYPIQGALMGGLRAAAEQQGRADLASLWSGQSAPLSTRQSAAETFAYFAEAYASER